jgi:CheY-like chemotaxis protein
MDGYQAAKKIRDLEKNQLNLNDRLAYIIGLTAHSTESYKIHCFESGMNEFSKYHNIVYLFYSD